MFNIKNIKNPYLLSIVAVVGVAAACYPFTHLMGYRVVAFILLLIVSLLAMTLRLKPVLLAAFLSALIWDFFFIPPYFTLYVSNSEDVLMLIMYFIVALLNGVFSARIRHFETLAREKQARATTLKLYDTLFNALSHELRTPITTILGASDNLLTKNAPLTEGVKIQLFQQINDAAERLNRMVNNLLNMSRLESDFVQPKLDWCDVNELIFTVLNHLETELKGRKVNVHIAENMQLVKLDFGLMEQALHNIIFNASIYTPEGSTIDITATHADGFCSISIEDGGLGFKTADLPNVFERFYRGENTQAGGIGLGLSISKGFVDAHNGQITVENVAGSGAKFTILIPMETTAWQTLDNNELKIKN